MTTTVTALRLCAACGCHLSRYNDGRLCAACESRVPEPPARSVDLERLIAGLLLVHSALHGCEPLPVGRELSAMGVEADSWAVQRAVRRAARRHGLICRGVRGRPGYSVVDWETRYRPVTGFGGVLMQRDQESGLWTGVSGCDAGEPVGYGQLSMLPR